MKVRFSRLALGKGKSRAAIGGARRHVHPQRDAVVQSGNRFRTMKDATARRGSLTRAEI
jgi:hypothetical protein